MCEKIRLIGKYQEQTKFEKRRSEEKKMK